MGRTKPDDTRLCGRGLCRPASLGETAQGRQGQTKGGRAKPEGPGVRGAYSGLIC
jgi:hypothetical protein